MDSSPENTVHTKGRHAPWWLISVMFFNAIIGFGGGWLASSVHSDGISANPSAETNQRIVSSEGEVIADVAEQVSPSVVSINVQTASQSVFGQVATSESAGTGIVMSSDGVIVSNKHVIADGATKITVKTSDNKKYTDIEVIGRDPLNDIAYIKVKGVNDFKPAKIGDSDKLRVGDKAIAIGNALGEYNNTVTSGIISAKGRPVEAGEGAESEKLSNLIQTDTAINQGNSGGPLVNISGEVIGMNTALAGNAQNIGFAIPINDIKPGLSTVLGTGKFERPYLGVQYISLDESNAKDLNVSSTKGAYVKSASGQPGVIAGGPADKAGVKDGDIITKIDDKEIDPSTQISNIVGSKKVGDTVNLHILRGDKQIDISVKLEAAPSS